MKGKRDLDAELHHRSYRRLGGERLDELTPLCGRHHDALHADGLPALGRAPGAQGGVPQLRGPAQLNTNHERRTAMNKTQEGLREARSSERRAIGSIMRWGEREGLIAPPRALRELVDTLPDTAGEIDAAFELLVTPEGRTVGGTLALADADRELSARLREAGLAELRPDGRWSWAERGLRMGRLLDAYADGRQAWTFLGCPITARSTEVKSVTTWPRFVLADLRLAPCAGPTRRCVVRGSEPIKPGAAIPSGTGTGCSGRRRGAQAKPPPRDPPLRTSPPRAEGDTSLVTKVRQKES